MGTFGEAEREILLLMSPRTEFEFNNKKYRVLISGKPTCRNGEPKTDIYIKAQCCTDRNDIIEIKISYKKENADFLENKISDTRAKQLFGDDWKTVIKKSTESIRDDFLKRMLIYKKALQKTEAGAITLGWKFEFVNKVSGDLSGEVIMNRDQLKNLVLDVYAGVNLSKDKKDAMVNKKIIKDSGVANYLLMDDTVSSAQDVIDRMISIDQYIDSNPKIYFACKALNLRSFCGKLYGDFSGTFTGKLDGKAKGSYQKKIGKNEYDAAVPINGTGTFEGIIIGNISGSAKGKFEGDMSSFILSNRVTKRSPKGSFKPKWDGDRPLAVYVDWSEADNKLTPTLVFDEPLIVKGNSVAERLIKYMKNLNITSTKDIDAKNSGTDKIVLEENN